jgi:hypothetical protein
VTAGEAKSSGRCFRLDCGFSKATESDMTSTESAVPEPSYREGRSDLHCYLCVEMFIAGFAPKVRSMVVSHLMV